MTSMGNQTRMTRIVSLRCAYYATAAKIVEDQKLLTIIAKLCILDNCGRCDDYFFFFFKKLESCFHYVNIVAVKQCVIETQSWLVLFTFIEFFLYIFLHFKQMSLCTNLPIVIPVKLRLLNCTGSEVISNSQKDTVL